jgi:hypothetical protein
VSAIVNESWKADIKKGSSKILHCKERSEDLPFREVTFSDWELAINTVTELDTGIATSIVGTYKFCAMLDIFWYDKVCRLNIG